MEFLEYVVVWLNMPIGPYRTGYALPRGVLPHLAACLLPPLSDNQQTSANLLAPSCCTRSLPPGCGGPPAWAPLPALHQLALDVVERRREAAAAGQVWRGVAADCVRAAAAAAAQRAAAARPQHFGTSAARARVSFPGILNTY